MMINGIHHINFVVRDLHSATEYFSKLLKQAPIKQSLKNREVDTARYLIGDSYVVLVCPTSDKGPVREILDKCGEGIFLVSFSAASIEQCLEELEEEGIFHLSERRTGVDDWDICDISPIERFGAILQLTKNKL